MTSALALLMAAGLTVQIASRDGKVNAFARLLDGGGKVLDELELPEPKATVRAEQLAGRTLWLVEADLDQEASAGRYNGISAYVLDAEGGRLRYVEAVDAASGQKGRIRLLHGQSAAWRLKGGEFFSVHSTTGEVPKNPGEDIPRFRNFRRISFEKGRWVVHERREPEQHDYAAQIEPFPGRSAFP